ncbi:UNVERIFIED_CONTAM: GTP-binding protein ERG [Sesamum radiatum]|uniref:GTP-binding protein ERG n=1 Tax=Sesamum radiatum TaxID=300843 RepID=A0AAW2T0X6_SESRA
MKTVRALRILTSIPTAPSSNSYVSHLTTSPSPFLHRFYSAHPQSHHLLPPTSEEYDAPHYSVFDSSQFDDLNLNSNNTHTNTDEKPTWDDKYRDRVKSKVFGEDISHFRILQREEEKKKKAAALAKELLEAALDVDEHQDVDEREVTLEDQKSLSVGIIGAPNAGKSALTNYMVGTKVSAVSRKINTTTHEVLGVLTKGDTQICFFDTPGLMLKKSGFPYNIKVRNESAWSSVNLYDVLIVIFDVHRHLTRRFMVSGLKGAGVKDLTKYLVDQAVKRPWDEDPFTMSEEVMKNISLEVVREKLLDYVHQEIPYGIEHRLMGWKELRDGSLRIEQHFITPKISQRKILVGKKGSKIGRIGVEANEELRSIFKRNVHLILMVRVK